ncbi:MAG: hypothetical protein AAF481_14725 [Acidobacteriota bacterium]
MGFPERYLPTVVLSLVAAHLVFGHSPTSWAQEIPPVLYADVPLGSDPSIPVWLAADVAVDPDGSLSELLSSGSQLTIHSLLRNASPNRCTEVTEFYDHDVYITTDRSTLQDALEGDALIVLARVDQSAPGFLRSEPGQMFSARVLENLKGNAPNSIYFFVPVGEFRAGPYRICKVDMRYKRIPIHGDEVVLMVPRVTNTNEPFLALSTGAGLFQRTEDGWLVPPSRFRDVSVKWSAFLRDAKRGARE